MQSNLRLVVCQSTQPTTSLLGTIIMEKVFSTNSIPKEYGEIIFIASTGCSEDPLSDINTLLAMWKAETHRPGKKIKISWVDSGTIQVL